jgi:hypothetical protein
VNFKDRAGAIRKHPLHKTHKAAVLTLQVKPMDKHVEQLNERAVVALEKRFRSLYWLAKETIANRKYGSLLELETLNGAYDGLQDLFQEGTYTYTSRDFVNEGLKILATVVHGQVMLEVHASPFFAGIADETMDISRQSQLIQYYKYVHAGKPKVAFGGILRLRDGTSVTVTAAMRWRLLKDNLRVAKMACLGSDGCGVMLGCNTGVAVRFISLNPFMVAFHCGGHRETLGAKGAADDVPFISRTFFPITEQLGRYYGDSATRTASFEAQQLAAGLEVRKVILSAFTRWLSHDGVTNVIHIRFISIVKDLHSNSVSDPTALGLYITICSRDYIAVLLLMRDNLPQLARLNKIFQDPYGDWSVIELELPVLLAHIDGQIETPGPHYNLLNEFIARVEADGLPVRCVAGRGEDWLEVNRIQYLTALGDHLRARFPHVPLMSAFFKLFNAHQYPADDAALRHFGGEHLDVVLGHYAAFGVVNAEETRLEWPAVRKWISFFRGKEKKVTCEVDDEDAEWDVMEARPTKKVEETRKVPVVHILEDFLNDETLVRLNPCFVLLMVLFLVFTTNSSDCERGFSTMKRIKTALRNRLGQDTLEQLMYICINGPDIKDFDFRAAVKLFVNLKVRLLKTPTLASVAARKVVKAQEAMSVWGAPVPDKEIEAEKDRDLAAGDRSHIFTGVAAEGRATVKRKDAAVLVRERKKNRHEENRDITLAIVRENQEEIEELGEEIGGEKCDVCEKTAISEKNMMLLCDGQTDGIACNSALHLLCHIPPLDMVPPGHWFCEKCDLRLERSQRGRRVVRKAMYDV